MKKATREKNILKCYSTHDILRKGIFYSLALKGFPEFELQYAVVPEISKRIFETLIFKRTNKNNAHFFKMRILTKISSQDPGGRGVAPRRPSVEKVFSCYRFRSYHSQMFLLPLLVSLLFKQISLSQNEKFESSSISGRS